MENRNKIIILALVVVIGALLVGIFASMPNFSKQATNLTFKCNSTINEGDSIRIQLTDANGTGIANQTVNITVMDKDKSTDHHSVVTNAKGVGTLNIDKSAGNYIITVKYDGNGNYAGCNATKNIKIEQKVVEAVASTPSNDPGAFYSAQYGGMVYTGDVHDSPAGPMRHLGNNKWEPA